MLPLVDKPTIQYGVEEACDSGVPNIVIVTGRGKNAIEDHFDVSTELEAFLESRGKKDLADQVRKISELINVSYVRQGEPLGLGHAVLVTETIVGNEPFAVILADDVIDATPPALKQMIGVFGRAGRCSPSSACRWTRCRITASSPARRRPSLAKACIASPISSRSRPETKRRQIWRSSAATSSHPTSFDRCMRRQKTSRARSS